MSECVIAGMGGGIKAVSGTVNSEHPINVNLGAKPKIVFFYCGNRDTGFTATETRKKIMYSGNVEIYASITADGFAIEGQYNHGAYRFSADYTAIF